MQGRAGQLVVNVTRAGGVARRRGRLVADKLGRIGEQRRVDRDASGEARGLGAVACDRAGECVVAVDEQGQRGPARQRGRRGRGRHRVHGDRRSAVVEDPQVAARIGELQPGRSQCGVELRRHRRGAAGEVDAHHGVVGIRRRRVRQRQGGGVVHPHHRDGVLDVGGVGIGDIDGVAGREAADVGVEARLRRSGHRGGRRGGVRKRARHLRGELVDLALCLHQHVVAHVEIAGDLARADGAVGDEVDARAVGRDQGDGAERALAQIGVPLLGRPNGAGRGELERRRLRPHQLSA